MDVSEPASISTGIAQRYAQAVFELSREGDALSKLEADVTALDEAIRSSSDLRGVLVSPLVSRKEQGAALGALAQKMGLGDVLSNTLRLMASKRRLFVVPNMVVVLKRMLSEERGEVTAEVRTAKALSEAQAGKLAQALKSSTGKDVRLDVTVDDALIGGLVVKIGSRMIDMSVRAKLNALQNTMKEVR
nr:F0F1 ATP synthase subunit delta [uncultured Jannaschia sp.]